MGCGCQMWVRCSRSRSIDGNIESTLARSHIQHLVSAPATQGAGMMKRERQGTSSLTLALPPPSPLPPLLSPPA